ncbi:MAG: tyrosine-type recombinase/integrase [Elusimicrobia bacterium]|nr:tyrosine-type recombinase/integrase [Elusimicrobiota bacterium]
MRVYFLRHSFAKHLLDNGALFRKIGDLLGHQSLSSTLIYTRADVRRLRDVADNYAAFSLALRHERWVTPVPESPIPFNFHCPGLAPSPNAPSPSVAASVIPSTTKPSSTSTANSMPSSPSTVSPNPPTSTNPTPSAGCSPSLPSPPQPKISASSASAPSALPRSNRPPQGGSPPAASPSSAKTLPETPPLFPPGTRRHAPRRPQMDLTPQPPFPRPRHGRLHPPRLRLRSPPRRGPQPQTQRLRPPTKIPSPSGTPSSTRSALSLFPRTPPTDSPISFSAVPSVTPTNAVPTTSSSATKRPIQPRRHVLSLPQPPPRSRLAQKHGPRIHDLRHTFAVHRLYKWYQDGADPLNKLPDLSTFMGHACFENTQVYLTITKDLLREGDKRFQALAEDTAKNRSRSSQAPLMKSDLAGHLKTFFFSYLRQHRGVSPLTLKSYADTFRLLLRFLAARHRSSRPFTVKDLQVKSLLAFLQYLEDKHAGRSNSPFSRNLRLAAIQSFFRIPSPLRARLRAPRQTGPQYPQKTNPQEFPRIPHPP